MRELAHPVGIAGSLCYLGMVATEQGDYPAARLLYVESLLIFRQLGDIAGTASALEGLAAAVAALGSPLRAARFWGAADRLRAEVGFALATSGAWPRPAQRWEMTLPWNAHGGKAVRSRSNKQRISHWR